MLQVTNLVCKCQLTKSPVELDRLEMKPGLMRGETGGLANEAYLSNPIISSKQ